MVEKDPEKFHVFNFKKHAAYLAILIAFSLIFVPAISYKYYKFAINRPAQNEKELTFEIKKGQGVAEIANSLYEKNLVNSPFLFKVCLVTTGLQKNIQAGTYIIPAGTSIVELAKLFQHGTDDIKITFLEGWRVEEYAREVVEKYKKVDYERFLKIAKSSEGCLFPDTYMFNIEVTEEEMLETLKETFDEKTGELLTTEALSKVGLTKEQAVVFASIVEREVYKDEDRPIVAGILMKRWRNGDFLGADATVQYTVAHYNFCMPPECKNKNAGCRISDEVNECLEELSFGQAMEIEWWPNVLTQSDLEYDNPYNTRKVTGLPPTAISNPGLSAIEAVLDSTSTEYNYYLTADDGTTYYSKTLEGHNLNVARYL